MNLGGKVKKIKHEMDHIMIATKLRQEGRKKGDNCIDVDKWVNILDRGDEKRLQNQETWGDEPAQAKKAHRGGKEGSRKERGEGGRKIENIKNKCSKPSKRERKKRLKEKQSPGNPEPHKRGGSKGE